MISWALLLTFPVALSRNLAASRHPFRCERKLDIVNHKSIQVQLNLHQFLQGHEKVGDGSSHSNILFTRSSAT